MVYEIKLKIKNYAELTIYTSMNGLKDKFLDDKSPIKRTIPITDVTYSIINKCNISYIDAIIINDDLVKEMFYDKDYNVAVLNVKEDEIRFFDLIYISLSMFSKILGRRELIQRDVDLIVPNTRMHGINYFPISIYNFECNNE